MAFTLMKSVYAATRAKHLALLFCGVTSIFSFSHAAYAQSSQANQSSGSNAIVEARDALRKKDRNALAAARASALASQHPLAMWPDYFELSNRLSEAQQSEVDGFYARWPQTYVEDRLRNDWLLELGKRRDWRNFATDFPRFRMNDDREVSCYALMLDQAAGKDVGDTARALWFAQKEADDGCALMAAALTDAKVFNAADAWRKARLAVEASRLRSARQAVTLIDVAAASGLQDLYEAPSRYLLRKASAVNRTQAELTTLALIRLANTDADGTAAALNERWERALPADLAAWAWASAGKQAAQKLSADAADYFQRADTLAAKTAGASTTVNWPDDTLAWKLRAALRANNGAARWPQVVQAVNAMSAAEQADAAWTYWKARGLQAMASSKPEAPNAAQWLEESRSLMAGISSQLNFYGKLAADNLGQRLTLPPKPAPFTAEERANAVRHPGMARALQLINLGLRSEGVREWNFSLRGMSDRELLAAAQMACDREVWDRCINTSDRTKVEVDMEQRFPTPFRKEVLARAREIGLDPAYVYGLIRQESRFIMDARSSVGASGLMQIMPATARWTAKRIGLDYTPDLIADRDTNLKLGTTYLKLALDDLGGSQAMAAAAYNAGPSRPRKWREGPVLETAAWAENIPFAETRDYVKKVLSNATYYAAMLNGEPPNLKSRLGRSIGPRDANAPAENKDLP